MKFTYLTFMLALVSVLFLGSCKDKPKESGEDAKTEMAAGDQYQCPMDCEDGKTYAEAGSCPVCKMDTKLISEAQ
ncbi:heavy metal-binding domain-containing protein [Maribacter sp. 2307ULW6-5]|uniref:heavy metal-binding domain-containing protein n=1 Tax=Maribacter sp. 2307ULW6-5 TaxID=3386275 RepID=UPI0039BD162F